MAITDNDESKLTTMDEFNVVTYKNGLPITDLILNKPIVQLKKELNHVYSLLQRLIDSDEIDTFANGNSYTKDAIVKHDGAFYICEKDTCTSIVDGFREMKLSGTADNSDELDAEISAIRGDVLSLEENVSTNLFDKTTQEDQTIAGAVTINNDLHINGNLTQTGTFTTHISEEVIIEDNIFVLNSNANAQSPPTENAGWAVNRGDQGVQNIIYWDEDNDAITALKDSSDPNALVYDNLAFESDLNAEVTRASTAESTIVSDVNANFLNKTTSDVQTIAAASVIISNDLHINGNTDISGYLKVDDNTVWHTGNDGPDTGLNADLLDGMHASAFALASHSHSSYLPLTGGTITGDVTLADDARIRGEVTITGLYSKNTLTLSNRSPTMLFDDITNDAHDFYIRVHYNSFYIMRDRDGTGDYSDWDEPHPLRLDSDNDAGYLFGNRMFDENYHPNADKWTAESTLTLDGHVSGSVSWDGSANVTLDTTVDINKLLNTGAAVGKILSWEDSGYKWIDMDGGSPLVEDPDGTYTLGGNLDITGDLTLTGNVNGRDIATDGAKLDRIETGANNYSHPAGSGDKHIPSGGAADQVLIWKSDGTAEWGNIGGSLTILEPATDTVDIGSSTKKFKDLYLTGTVNTSEEYVNTSNIVDLAVTADKIAAGAVTADKIIIGDTTNLINNPGIEYETGWDLDGAEFSEDQAYINSKSIKVAGNTASWSILNTKRIEVNEGDKFKITFRLYKESTDAIYLSIGLQLEASYGIVSTKSISQSYGAGSSNEWQEYSVFITLDNIPSSARYGRLKLKSYTSATISPYDSDVYFDSFKLQRSPVTLIEDGDITADKLAPDINIGSNNTGSLTILEPETTDTVDIGSADNRFKDLYLSGTVNSDIVKTRVIKISENPGYPGFLLPETTNTVDIGSSTNKFRNLYLSDAVYANYIYAGGITANLTKVEPTTNTVNIGSSTNKFNNLYLSGTVNSNTINISSSITPSDTDTVDIGSTDKRFKDLYLSGDLTLTGEVNGRDIEADGAKLDNIETGANNFSLPSGGSTGQVLIWSADGTGAWGNMGGSSPLVEDPDGTYTLTGNLVVTGDVTSQSDEKLKENITTIESALDIVESLNGVYYNLKTENSTKRHVGLIAQNVQSVLPEAVEGEEYLSVAYGNIVGVLVEAIKELKAEIAVLKNVNK